MVNSRRTTSGFVLFISLVMTFTFMINDQLFAAGKQGASLMPADKDKLIVFYCGGAYMRYEL